MYAVVDDTLPGFNPVDSIIFGFHPNATNGLDVQLGELSLPNNINGQYDLRVIQRDADDFDCLYNEDNEQVYFDQSFDSKINLRPINVNESSKYFEVLNYSLNFTGYYVSIIDYLDDSVEINDQYLGMISMVDCPPTESDLLNVFEDWLFGLANGFILLSHDLNYGLPFERFFFKLEPDTSLTVGQPTVNDFLNFKIYPNPTSGLVNIESSNLGETLIEVYNSLGERLYSNNVNQTTLDLSHFENGMYFIKSSINNQSHIHRILKVD